MWAGYGIMPKVHIHAVTVRLRRITAQQDELPAIETIHTIIFGNHLFFSFSTASAPILARPRTMLDLVSRAFGQTVSAAFCSNV
jgi:hypothetical protein